MTKIHSFFGLFLATVFLLCLLTGAIVFYNIQSRNIQDLTLASSRLAAQWNSIQNKTYQILLDRYTLTDEQIPLRIREWEEEYKGFSSSLEELSCQGQIQKLPEIPRKLDGIERVWRYTEVQLNNAGHFFMEIIQTGLGRKVMVNGFLHTMYKLRMTGQLTTGEIFLLDDTIYALETLDNASKEFDTLFFQVISDLNTAGEKYLRRVRFVAAGFLLSIILILAFLFVLQYQLTLSQQNRKLYLESRKQQLLKDIIENSSEENLNYYASSREELSLQLQLNEPVIPFTVQIDNYSDFSHRHNIAEQQTLIGELNQTLSEILDSRSLKHDYFRYRDDLVVFLFNPEQEEEYEQLLSWMEDQHSKLLRSLAFSITLSFGEICSDPIDLDQDFRDLMKIGSYRFLSGKGSFLYSGSSYLTTYRDFHYPREKEGLFEESMKSLNEEETLALLDDLIDYGFAYGPQNMRRLIIRLTASLSATVEFLEKTYHIQTIERVTPMILQVQSPETIEEVKALMIHIIQDVIRECRNRKEARHDQTVSDIRDQIENEIENFNLSADWLADRFQLSTGYINRLFKQHMGLSIAGYINQVRLEKAAELLRTSERTVADIAETAGFASLGTFFRLFKKRFGRSPREYQKEMGKS